MNFNTNDKWWVGSIWSLMNVLGHQTINYDDECSPYYLKDTTNNMCCFDVRTFIFWVSEMKTTYIKLSKARKLLTSFEWYYISTYNRKGAKIKSKYSMCIESVFIIFSIGFDVLYSAWYININCIALTYVSSPKETSR